MGLNRISAMFLVIFLGVAPTVHAAAICPAGNTLSTPTADFTVDSANGVVTHNNTGLMWKQCVEGASGAACGSTPHMPLTWSAALSAAAVPFAGYSDWRLPNLKELRSIVETGCYYPSINEVVFPNTPIGYFWSTTAQAVNTANTWSVFFGEGFSLAWDRTNNFYVRLVRGGQFVDSFDAQGDIIPDAFSFIAQTGVTLSTVITSNPITVTRISTASPISIAGGSYAINGGTYTSVAGMVSNGDTVTVQQTSSDSYSTLTTATLTIGGVSSVFDVTTLALPDATPDVFDILNMTNQAVSTAVTTNAVVVAGIDVSVTAATTLGTIIKNGVDSGSASASVRNGDTVAVNLTTSESYSTTTIGALTIGIGATSRDDFTVTTLAAPLVTTSHTAPSATGTGNITASFTGGGAGCGYTVSQYIPLAGHVASPPSGTAPAGVNFPHGLFDFTTGGCTPGATITLTITYPQALPAGTTYWKYGPTPGNTTYHWYQLPASIAGNSATFSITDGGLGDDDLAANGSIVDQGGPGVPGGAAIPTLSEWVLLALAGLIGVFGLGALRRRAAL